MKRDMDLCRHILLAVESNPEADGSYPLLEFSIDGKSGQEVSYHIRLLAEAGLLKADDSAGNGDELEWCPRQLTWEGHEFLDASRKDTLWQKGKSIVLEKTEGLSFDVLKAVLIKLATHAVLGTGS
jgi:hypothetical protein